MYNERGVKVNEVGPATPALILGLNGAPQAGDKFNVMESDREAKEIATKRAQLQREQGLRTQKHITLDEIGRRIAIGNFQELNIGEGRRGRFGERSPIPLSNFQPLKYT